MSQPDDVDKMLSDFLVELQALSDSLQASGQKAAPVSGAEQSHDMPREVLPVVAQQAVMTQPTPFTDAESATSPVPLVRDIRVLLMDNARPPVKAKEQEDEFPHSCKALYDSRFSSRAQTVRRVGRVLLWPGISLVLVCLLVALYSRDPLAFRARWKRLVPPAPSAITPMPDPSPAIPAVPVGKIVAALPTPPGSRASQPPIPAAARASTGHTIGVSYRTVTAQLGKFFAMKTAKRLEGQDRYIGQTDDKMATLEIIGNKNNVSEACFMAGLPTDNPGAAERNGGFAFSFIQNIEPEWTDAPNWIAENLVNITNSQTEYVEIVRGERRVRLRWRKTIGMMSISVRHKGQEEPITEQAPPE